METKTEVKKEKTGSMSAGGAIGDSLLTNHINFKGDDMGVSCLLVAAMWPENVI